MLLALSCLFVLACPGATTPPAEQIGPEQRIAGTWLGTLELDDPEYPPTAFITTYHADGTATTSTAKLPVDADRPGGALSGTHHVQWEAIGPREIRWTLLHFGRDREGRLQFVSRTHGVNEFDEDYQVSRGRFDVEVYGPTDLLDPLDPNSEGVQPIATATGTSEARRLRQR